jgi:hypothetical protein
MVGRLTMELEVAKKALALLPLGPEPRREVVLRLAAEYPVPLICRATGWPRSSVYHRKRIYPSLGYLTPAEFEQQWRRGAESHGPAMDRAETDSLQCPSLQPTFRTSGPHYLGFFLAWLA